MTKGESQKKVEKRVLGRMMAKEISAEELKEATGGLLGDGSSVSGSTGSCCCDPCCC